MAAVTENVDDTPIINGEARIRPDNKRNNARRGPNRRRPRNPNYKRQDSASDEGRDEGNGGGERGEAGQSSNPSSSYAAEFADRQANGTKPEQAASPVAIVENASPYAVPKPDSVGDS